MGGSGSGVRRVLVGSLLVAAAATFVGVRRPVDVGLHHTGTVAGVVLLLFVDRRERLSAAAFGAVVVFLAAHVVGARWLYSNVPYDDWSEALTGSRISDVLGAERNHYDRLVHLLYGLLLSLPLQELLTRRARLAPVLAALLTFTVVAATSALYELLEWGLAVVLAPEAAERYNGQQGDMWDAQKDMALALLGSVVGLVGLAARPKARAAA